MDLYVCRVISSWEGISYGSGSHPFCQEHIHLLLFSLSRLQRSVTLSSKVDVNALSLGPHNTES